MIKCYHCSGKHELVSQVKDCAKVPTAFAAKVEIGTVVETVIPATVKVAAVPAHRTDAKYLALKAQVAPAVEVTMVKIPGLDISVPAPVKTIDQQVAEHDAALAVIKKGQDLELGMYQITDVNGIQMIYKIKWNKTNTYKYAEKLVITDGKWSKTGKPSGKFMYAGSMMSKLTSENKMTEQQAKDFHDATKAKYGVDYGFCCVCGKLLTVKKSIDAGIGPVCQTKF
jgi:hypothetical protein